MLDAWQLYDMIRLVNPMNSPWAKPSIQKGEKAHHRNETDWNSALVFYWYSNYVLFAFLLACRVSAWNLALSAENRLSPREVINCPYPSGGRRFSFRAYALILKSLKIFCTRPKNCLSVIFRKVIFWHPASTEWAFFANEERSAVCLKCGIAIL